MTTRWVGIVAAICALTLLVGTGPAGAARKYTLIRVTTSPGHVCSHTYVSGLNASGTAVGTSSCGHGRDEVFVRTKAGHVSFYRLPAKDANQTRAIDIA